MNKLFKNILKQNNYPFLYAVTSELCETKNLLEQIIFLNKMGIKVFQLRQKKLEQNEFIALAKKIKSKIDKHSILIINDNLDVAKIMNADGIHIGQDDKDILECRKVLGPNKMIGVSVQTLEQAILAEQNGADYIGVGSMFDTNTKTDAIMVSQLTLIEICKNVKIPLVVIGGINVNNIDVFKEIRIDGIAMISTLFNNPNCENDLLNIFDKFSKW